MHQATKFISAEPLFIALRGGKKKKNQRALCSEGCSRCLQPIQGRAASNPAGLLAQGRAGGCSPPARRGLCSPRVPSAGAAAGAAGRCTAPLLRQGPLCATDWGCRGWEHLGGCAGVPVPRVDVLLRGWICFSACPQLLPHALAQASERWGRRRATSGAGSASAPRQQRCALRDKSTWGCSDVCQPPPRNTWTPLQAHHQFGFELSGCQRVHREPKIGDGPPAAPALLRLSSSPM